MAYEVSRRFALLLTVGLLGCDGPAGFDEPEVEFRCYPDGGVGFVGLESIEVSGNANIAGSHASIFSNKHVALTSGSYTIEGNVYSGGTTSVKGPGPQGLVVENAGTMVVEDPKDIVFDASTSNDNHKIACGSCMRGNHFSLSGSKSVTFESGDYYFESISVNGKATINIDGDVVFHLNGPATLNGGSAINPGSDTFTLFSAAPDQITINGNSESVMYVHAPHADVRVNGTAKVKGGIVAKRLKVSGTADIIGTTDILGVLGLECHFDGHAAGGPPPGLPSLPN